MKKTIGFLLMILRISIICLMVYLGASFVELTFNAFKWSNESRIIVITITPILCVFVEVAVIGFYILNDINN